ncbi:acyltransferase [Minwuia thermotolerans]|nr:acyltransferase [Minwuia thermotolerans]
MDLGARVGIRENVIIGGYGHFIVGNDTAINEGCIITAMEKVEIGANVMLAPRVYLLDVDHRFERRDIPISKQGYLVRPVRIEDDVWIGTGAVITKGVTIGRGAIIGANSVVTRDVPAYAIAAGVPAMVVKGRPE